jgi:geranylgeranyl diphosphate synthase type I
MAYWGFVGAGGDPDDPAIGDLGAALELLQAFALFHDDVMDGSATRRGEPTAHVREIDRHREGGWRGEARRYGEAVAILAGDISLVLADVLLAEVPAEVRRLWNELRVEVNLGQFLDVVGSARGDVSAETADRIVEYKTARYTILRPLQMGAALAGRAELVEPLSAVGTPLGVAFQLRDDLLGALGNSDITGKPVGDDLIEGKPTPLLLLARARADAEQSLQLDRVGTPMSAAEVVEIQTVLRETGAVAEIEARIASLTGEARTALSESGLTADARAQLDEIAVFLAGRTT